jgi:hypothetical protein
MNQFLIMILLMSFGKPVFSQAPPLPRHYICYKVSGPIVLDGKLNEESWKAASWSDAFLDIEGPEMPAPAEQTHIKMLWDDSSLYIGGHIETKNIWATLTEHDGIVFHDNDFEIFINPDGNNHNYGELEFNAFGTLMDIFLGKPYRNGGFPIFGWECKGIQYAVSYNGTINNPSDEDTAWNIEIKIPLKSIVDLQKFKKPIETGTQWRINFSRVQWDVKVENNSYQKLRKPEHNWVWSPQWVINMHRPEYWGYLQFSEKKVGTAEDIFLTDKDWLIKMQLMAVYEAEAQFYKTHQKFTNDFSKLKMPGYVELDKLSLEAKDRRFVAKYKNAEKELSVDEAGLLAIE